MSFNSEIWQKLLNLEREQGELSRRRICELLNVSDRVASGYAFALKNKDKITTDIQGSINEHKLRAERNELKKSNKKLIEENLLLQDNLDFAIGIKGATNYITIKDNPLEKSEAAAIAGLGDVHVEERVDKDAVDGLNEYNPDISKKRQSKFADNLLKLIRKERQAVKIDTLILALLGDMITGYIHEEFKKTNFMSPMEATNFEKNILISIIKFLAENGNFKRIIISCNKGNHGRNTIRKEFATAYKESFEWMMYQNIKETFEIIGGYDLLEWVIPKSEFNYVEIFGKVNRFCHGDHFRYIDGIGGLGVPMNKFLHRENKVKRADMTLIGHWHTYGLSPSNDSFVNGSLVGYNSYARALSLKPQPPLQTFMLLDKNYGYTGRFPIICE